MTEEFNLSNYVRQSYIDEKWIDEIDVKKVKEFIRLVLEYPWCDDHLKQKIKELAGEKLI